MCNEYGKITLILNILFIRLSLEYMDYVFIWLLAYLNVLFECLN